MYRMQIEMIGGNGKWGYDYFSFFDFDTYQEAYNCLRRWRSLVKRQNIRVGTLNIIRTATTVTI